MRYMGSDTSDSDVQKMIENAQSQPGLNEILRLVHHLNDARRALNDSGSSSTYVGYASVSSTPYIAITTGHAPDL
jgi:hypothetical protein